jgi:hypothetical protein
LLVRLAQAEITVFAFSHLRFFALNREQCTYGFVIESKGVALGPFTVLPAQAEIIFYPPFVPNRKQTA